MIASRVLFLKESNKTILLYDYNNSSTLKVQRNTHSPMSSSLH